MMEDDKDLDKSRDNQKEEWENDMGVSQKELKQMQNLQQRKLLTQEEFRKA